MINSNHGGGDSPHNMSMRSSKARIQKEIFMRRQSTLHQAVPMAKQKSSDSANNNNQNSNHGNQIFLFAPSHNLLTPNGFELTLQQSSASKGHHGSGSAYGSNMVLP